MMRPWSISIAGILLVFLLFFMVQVTLQWGSGSFDSEFGGYPDEAAHYVTGLMVRDYVAAFPSVSPLKFAEDYYLHYPKVALGHWPPLFYVVQAVWTLLFSPSRLSMLLLMALLTTMLAGSVYLVVRGELSAKIGMVIGLLLLGLPLIQTYSGMVMAEILVALLSFWAVVCFGHFLETEQWQDATSFGIFAALAVLTKGNGLALGLVPPLALLFSGRFHLLARPSFWYPVIIVLVFCGPWYWLTLRMVRNGWQEGAPTLKFTIEAAPYYLYGLGKITGIWLTLMVVIGFVTHAIWPCWKRDIGGKWAAITALLVSGWIFHTVVPAGLESRHLILVVPALMMFLAAGISSLANRLPPRHVTAGQKAIVLALVTAAIFVGGTFAIPKKSWYGFGNIAQQLLLTSNLEQSVHLISSDATGEGMFIAEMAMREQRPGHFVLRASKTLAKSRWDGNQYMALYSSPEEVMSYLEEVPVGVVVIDWSIPAQNQREHHNLLKETIETYAQRWEFLGSYPLTRHGTEYPNTLQVYSLLGHENRSVREIHLNMSEMLDKTFRSSDSSGRSSEGSRIKNVNP